MSLEEELPTGVSCLMELSRYIWGSLCNMRTDGEKALSSRKGGVGERCKAAVVRCAMYEGKEAETLSLLAFDLLVRAKKVL